MGKLRRPNQTHADYIAISWAMIIRLSFEPFSKSTECSLLLFGDPNANSYVSFGHGTSSFFLNLTRSVQMLRRDQPRSTLLTQRPELEAYQAPIRVAYSPCEGGRFTPSRWQISKDAILIRA